MDTPVVSAAAGKVNLKAPTSNLLGRGVPTRRFSEKCTCNRDKTIVFCRACGYYCNGRVRLQCSVHPRVTFLLDIAECPRCHSSFYLDEHCT